MPRPAPSRVAAALDYLERLKNQAAEFGGGVVENLADRARSVGGLAYEALTTDPNMGRMTTAEFSQAAADRAPTPRLDQTARDIGTIGRAIVTQPIQTGKAIVRGEVERAREAMTSPQAAGEYAGSFIDPMRIAAALRKTAPVLELDVYHGTPHRFPATEANPLGEFDASKIGTGEGAQAYGHGIYLAENPSVATGYRKAMQGRTYENIQSNEILDSDDLFKTARESVRKNTGLEEFPANYVTSKVLAWIDEGNDVNDFLKKNVVSDELKPAFETAIQFLQNTRPGGSFYKADLPDEMIDRMLDWDKPLSEQPAAVREHVMRYMNVKEGGLPADMSVIKFGGGKYVVVQEKPPLPGATFGIPRTITKGPRADSPEAAIKAYWDNLKGEDFYKTLSGDVGKGAAASEHLRSLGIPGIKYLDAGSRGQGGNGTRNFVVFPGEEKKVRILERK